MRVEPPQDEVSGSKREPHPSGVVGYERKGRFDHAVRSGARGPGARLVRVFVAVGIAAVFFGGLTAAAGLADRSAAAARAERALLAMVNDAHLPDVQKASMRRDIELVMDRFEQGELGAADLELVAGALADLSIVKVSELDALRSALAGGGLSESERRTGVEAIDRLAAGALEGRASPAEIDRLLGGLREAGSGVGRRGGRVSGGSRIVSEAELRELLSAVEHQASSLQRAAGGAVGYDAAAAFRARIEGLLGEPAKTALDAGARDVDAALDGLRRGR